MTLQRMVFLASLDDPLLDEVLARWRAAHPRVGVLALVPEAQQAEVGRLQAACARNGVALVGGVFPALIHDGRFETQGVWLLRLDEMPAYALHADLPRDPALAQAFVQTLTRQVVTQLSGDGEATLWLLFDAMVPNIGTLLDEVYLQLANRVHYAGANAGSETFAPMPCLFDGDRIVSNGLLWLLLPGHPGAVLEHGYAAPEPQVYATSTEGNCITQIDWRPAFEVYQELVQQRAGVAVTPANFYAHAVHFPFGIVRANHHVVVRIPVQLTDDGALLCVGEVPAHSVLTLLQSPAVDSVATLDTLTRGLQAMAGGSGAAADVLLFYCAGRRMHLGLEAAQRELQQFSQRSAAACVAGALSLGEIGGSLRNGYPLFHNAALVAAPWRG